MTRRIVCLGVVVGPHGVRGEFKVKVFTAAEASISAYGPLSDELGQRTLDIGVVRVAKPGLVVARAPQVRSREDAERLKGVKLFAPRDRLPPPDEGEFYIEDLVGLIALSDAGRPLGRVAAVHNFGAGDILEIRMEGAPALLAPFTLRAVPIVAIAAGHVTIAEVALQEWVAGDASQSRKEPEDQL